MAKQLFEEAEVSVGDVRRHTITFADVLDPDEKLTGLPVVTEESGDILVSGRALNAAVESVKGKVTRPGLAAQFTTSGQQLAGSPYTLTIEVHTTKGQTIHCDLVMRVS